MDIPHIPLTSAERELRKKLKREGKALKKAQREKQKIQNTIRLDKRPEVRMAAMVGIIEAPASGVTTDDHTELESEESTACSTKSIEADRVVSLIDMSLTEFSPSFISHPPSSIVELDLSHNCLSALPGLSSLRNLISLDICRNEFRSLPPSLAQLPSLTRLNASRNQLRLSADLLVLLTKPPLPSLQSLDITFNKKLFTQSLSDLLTASLPNVAIHLTVTSPPPLGAYVGDSPGERDAMLLRSQLEPFTTLQLRKRLVDIFGYQPYSMYGAPPEGRAQVMTSLLNEYEKIGPTRKLVRAFGTPVPPSVIEVVRKELEAWSHRYDKFQERPMIKAS
eukprot:scaffold37507_cov57-Attheya_sp.AAC.1